MYPWDLLCIEPSADERDIKRAYARLLKKTRPEDDPAAFQALRDAYEYALQEARLEHAQLAAPATPEAPQEYEDAAFGPFAVARLQPPSGDPALSRRDPEQEAQRLWALFLGTATVAPRHSLAQLTASDDMLDLQVREYFELCALRYCAGAACPDDTREAIADYYQWQADASFVAREAPEETGEMLARLRAQQSYAYFLSRASVDPAVKAILADSAGRDWGRTLDAKFTVPMRELVAAIRFQHSEMLYSKLDLDVFETWERRVEGRRYFLQTAGYSAIAGGMLWLVTVLTLITIDLLDNFGLADLLKRYWLASFLGCELLAFAVIGWLAVRQPGVGAAIGNWRNRVQFLMHELRFRPTWQFGWIGLYVAGAACLVIPAPPQLVGVAVTAALLAALAAAILANWGIVNRWGFFIAAVVGLGAGINMSENAVDGYGRLAWAAAVTCGMLLLYRGGVDFCQWLGVPDSRLPLARGAWLAGAAGLIAATHLVPLPLAACVMVAFLWLTAGMLLSNPTINHFFPFLGGSVARSILAKEAPVALPAPMPALTIFLIVVAVFMIVNILRADTHQTHFS